MTTIQYKPLREYNLNCHFCQAPLDTEDISINTISTTLECPNHPEVSSIYYRYKFHSDQYEVLKPYLYTIDIYLNANLLIRYFAQSKEHLAGHSEILYLYEKIHDHHVLPGWNIITVLPLAYMSKTLTNIVEKINLLKPFI
jgi:hypothetical protein